MVDRVTVDLIHFLRQESVCFFQRLKYSLFTERRSPDIPHGLFVRSFLVRRLDIAGVGFKTVMNREFKKTGVPFFCSRIDDCSHIVIEHCLGDSTDLPEEFYVG